ncbi:MAG: dihydroorotase [Armatimonadetes bacterium]|nr:dihydroorotase [Armatimonadota bacterium]
MNVLIRGGRVIDPSAGLDRAADVLIVDGRIAAVESHLDARADVPVIDAAGMIVAPGLVDMHVHFRDPGQTHKEDITSGAEAAARGGFTAVACMPNTLPPIDHPTVVEYVKSRARSAACRVYPIAAVSKGQVGQELAPIAGLAASGAVALSDDGVPVASAGLLRRAMSYASMFDLPVIEHCEDLTLSEGGVMHEGAWSTVLGLRGIPAASEEAVVARDLLLAEVTGARLHVAHVSSAGSVRMIREAKRRGVTVTAEVTPHHLVLTDESVQGFDAAFKMNPPLRTPADVEAVREGLLDGTIDAIATDHAPHAPEEKMVEFDAAPFGVIGLETALGVVWTALVQTGALTPADAIMKLSTAPASILKIPGGTLRPGSPADLVLIDPNRKWTVDAATFASKSRNTPFQGWTMTGKAVMTIVGGEIKHSDLEVEARV